MQRTQDDGELSERARKRRRLDEVERGSSCAQDRPDPELPLSSNRSYGMIQLFGDGRAHIGDRYHQYYVQNREFHLGKYNLLLESLTFERMDARLRNIATALPNTCEWLLHHEQFHAWVDPLRLQEHHGFLWIKGKPGCGKSTMMKTVLDRARKMVSQQTVLSYFFNARAPGMLEKSSFGLYRSLVHQILTKLPVFRDSFASTFADKERNGIVDEWNAEELKSFLVEVAENLEVSDLDIFIDGLDEGDIDDIRQMIAFLEDLGDRAITAGNRLRICLSSRHYPHISIRRGLVLVMEDQVEHYQDIQAFVQAKLHGDQSPEMHGLRQEVCNKSAGIFLWVVLIVAMLNKTYDEGGSLAESQIHLNILPNDLDALFTDILSKIQSDFEKCVTLLQIVLFSNRPLSAADLYVAIHYSCNQSQSTEISVPEAKWLARWLLNRSHGLVEVTNSEQPMMRFIHETVREFLVEHRGLAQMLSTEPENVVGLSHERLKRACFQCISCFEESSVENLALTGMSSRLPMSDKPNPPFLTYATAEIFRHADSAQQSGIDQTEFLTSFDTIFAKWIQLRNAFEKHTVPKHTDVTPLYIAAEQNLIHLVRCLLDKGSDVNGMGGRYGNALQVASVSGSVRLVQLLLERGADPNAIGGEYERALVAASAFGHSETVQILLDKGADVNIQLGSYNNALYIASENGHEKIVQILLSAGVDVNAQSGSNHSNALQAALYHGHEKVAQLLRDSGADFNEQRGFYCDALQTASAGGHGEVMPKLLVPPPTISLAADSGYATWTARSDKDASGPFDPDHSVVIHPVILEDDALSTYSDDSIATSQQDEVVQSFSEQLVKDLASRNFHAEWLDNSFNNLEHTLADFCFRLGQENATIAAREAVKFVHKNRRKLVKSFKACMEAHSLSFTINTEDQAMLVRHTNTRANKLNSDDNDTDDARHSTYSESDDEGHSRVIDKPLSVSEKMDLWRQSTTDDEQTDCGPSQVPSDATITHTPFKRYYDLVSSTSSYKWLQSALWKVFHVCETDAALMQHIKDTILDSFPYPLRIGRQTVIPSFSAEFIVDWPLLEFARTLKPSNTDSGPFDALTITGTAHDSQALTCSAYVAQIWPENGKALLNLIDDVLKTGREQTCTRQDQTRLTAAEDGGHVKLKVQGSRGAVAEVGQQICWLSAALRPSGNKAEIMLCCPQIRRVDTYQDIASKAVRGPRAVAQQDASMDQLVKFEITSSLTPIISETKERDDKRDSTCWLDMFSAAVVACGFPIAGCRREKHGLEMPLDVMATLVGTEYADHFDRKLFIKGYSSMLVSSQALDDLIIWHYCQTNPDTYISYFDHEVHMSQSLEIGHLSRSRHIIGWCEEADFKVGAAEPVQQVQWSRLKPEPQTSSPLLRSCHLNFPVRIAKDSIHVVSTEQQPSKIMADSYGTIFRTLRRNFVLLWDTEGERGWLVNALSTLLHLMRNSLQIDKDLLGNLFVLRPEDLQEPVPGILAARDFLSNVHNLHAKVSISGVSSEAPDNHEILGTRMVLFYHVLRQAFDVQRKRLDTCYRPWQQLEGWDFRSLATQKGSSVRSIRISPEAKGWVELVKATGAITLFGRGFGELIHPSDKTTSHCAYWQTLPTNKFYVAISTGDLIEMAEAHELDVTDQTGELAPNVTWHKSLGIHNSGSCSEHSCMTSSVVQVLTPSDKQPETIPPSQRLEIGKFKRGAFMFGHNKDVSWQWVDDEDSGELSKDSGYDSMDTTSNTLSRMRSDQSYATQASLPVKEVGPYRPGHSGTPHRIYASASFNGGNSQLGDFIGNKYENCQIHVFSTEESLHTASPILHNHLHQFAPLSTTRSQEKARDPNPRPYIPTLTTESLPESTLPYEDGLSCPQTDGQVNLLPSLSPSDGHDEEEPQP